jgi:HSP20 family molecular chaperone IbpA
MFIEQFLNSFVNEYDVEYRQKTTETGLELYIYLAGVKKSNISIQVNSNILSVEAKDKLGYSNWKFKNSWRLGSGLDVDKISSNYVDGVLTINIPKVKEENVRKIPVD